MLYLKDARPHKTWRETLGEDILKAPGSEASFMFLYLLELNRSKFCKAATRNRDQLRTLKTWGAGAWSRVWNRCHSGRKIEISPSPIPQNCMQLTLWITSFKEHIVPFKVHRVDNSTKPLSKLHSILISPRFKCPSSPASVIFFSLPRQPSHTLSNPIIVHTFYPHILTSILYISLF